MKRTITLVAALAILLAACGAEPGTVDSPRRVEVSAAEMAFDPSSIDITDGETVEFVITNSGALTHEFVVTNQEEIDEHLEAGHEEGHDEGEEGHEGAPLEVEIEPGETGTLVVTFDDPDHMARFACLIEGHYEAGMHGDFDLSG
jgi:uncharacterized cupredoxin-like copper-binding protein